jgi:hypothetical protein
MIIIDKSHSKLDLIELFEKLSVIIPKKTKKPEIVENITTYIQSAKYIPEIKDVSVLIDILKSKTTKQRPNMKLKNSIMIKSKKIIKCCSSNSFSEETYLSHEDVYNDLLSICSYGDISAVRKACHIYNDWTMCINHINPIISADKMKSMVEKKQLKKNKVFGIKAEHKPILVEFR